MSASQVWFCPWTFFENTWLNLLPWWRNLMEPFSALLAFCAGNSPVTGEFHTQRPVTRSFDVFFELRLNKQLSKQSWGWWFETTSCPLWHQCNAMKLCCIMFKFPTIVFSRCFKLFDWMSLWCLGPIINHFPPVCQSIFWQMYSKLVGLLSSNYWSILSTKYFALF